MKYSAPLDGIRAVAILGVLAYHISPDWLVGGFTGVDVFFVLSGFLITSIIVADIREGRFSLREFYLRRIQRLLPNIVVTVLAVIVLWNLFLPPSAASQAARHGLWTVFNLSNFFAWKHLGGYWGDAADWAPLLHTWSLGVEEQFYLVFPGTLLLLARFQRRQATAWLAAAAALSFALCVYGSQAHPSANFYLLPTRIWELLFGAVLALRRNPLAGEGERHAPGGKQAREAMGWTGIAMILVGYVYIGEAGRFPGLSALLPTVGSLLAIASIVEGDTVLARLLSTRPMVGIGKLSYSLYLWHWPLITLGKIQAEFHDIPLLVGATAGALASIALATAAYFGVEKTLRRRGEGRAARLKLIGAGFSAAVVASMLLAFRPIVPDPSHLFDTPTFHGFLYSASRVPDPNPALGGTRYQGVHIPQPPLRVDDAWRSGGVQHLYGGGVPTVVVFGSSHALMYAKLIDDICREMGVSVAFFSVDQTPAFFSASTNDYFPNRAAAREFDETRLKSLAEWRPAALVVIDRWDRWAGAPQALDTELRSFLRTVSSLADRVLFVAQVPVAKWGDNFNLLEFMTWRMDMEGGVPRLFVDRNDGFRKQSVAIARNAAAEFRNIRVLRADLPFYREDGTVRWSSGRSFYFADDDHLTDAGAKVVRGLFRDALVEAHSRTH